MMEIRRRFTYYQHVISNENTRFQMEIKKITHTSLFKKNLWVRVDFYQLVISNNNGYFKIGDSLRSVHEKNSKRAYLLTIAHFWIEIKKITYSSLFMKEFWWRLAYYQFVIWNDNAYSRMKSEKSLTPAWSWRNFWRRLAYQFVIQKNNAYFGFEIGKMTYSFLFMKGIRRDSAYYLAI